MGLGDDSQNLHGINTTASRETLPVTARHDQSEINALLHACQRSCRDCRCPGPALTARYDALRRKCGNTPALVVLSVAMLVFFTRTARARCVASHFAPGRGVIGV